MPAFEVVIVGVGTVAVRFDGVVLAVNEGKKVETMVAVWGLLAASTFSEKVTSMK